MNKFMTKHQSAIVVVVGFLFLAAVGLYLDWDKEQGRKVEEAAVLTGNGYTDIHMSDERGTCPRGIYARWYSATNPAGKPEHGLVCMTYSDDVPYVIPTYSK